MTNITQEALSELAIALGKEAEIQEVAGCIEVIATTKLEDGFQAALYQPHKDPAQAFELIDWLFSENVDISLQEMNEHDYFLELSWNCGETHETFHKKDLKEAIVKAAISFIQEGK